MIFTEYPNLTYNQSILNTYLEENNLSKTIQRNEVLKTIVKIRQPFTVLDVVYNMEETGVSKASVYNSITLLLKAKILKRILIEDFKIKPNIKYELIHT